MRVWLQVWRDGAIESLPNFASLFVTGFAVFVLVVVTGTVWLILRGRRRPRYRGGGQAGATGV